MGSGEVWEGTLCCPTNNDFRGCCAQLSYSPQGCPTSLQNKCPIWELSEESPRYNGFVQKGQGLSARGIWLALTSPAVQCLCGSQWERVWRIQARYRLQQATGGGRGFRVGVQAGVWLGFLATYGGRVLANLLSGFGSGLTRVRSRGKVNWASLRAGLEEGQDQDRLAL